MGTSSHTRHEGPGGSGCLRFHTHSHRRIMVLHHPQGTRSDDLVILIAIRIRDRRRRIGCPHLLHEAMSYRRLRSSAQG